MSLQVIVIVLWITVQCSSALDNSNEPEGGVSMGEISSPGKGTVCQQKICTCKDFTVDCNHAHLRDIPSGLPRDTKVLMLAGNNIEGLDLSKFASVPMLEYLDLSSNNVMHIESRTFENLKYLVTLVLNKNNLDAKSLKNSLCSLRSYNVSLVFQKALGRVNTSGDRQIVFESFKCLEGKQVKRLDLSHNHVILLINSGLLSNLSFGELNIRNVSGGYQPMEVRKLSASVKNLDISYNKLHAVPVFHDRGKSFLPNLSALHMGGNYFESLLSTNFIGLETIDTLYMIRNEGIVQNFKSDSFKSLTSITHISLKFIKFHDINNVSCMFENPRLETLILSNMRIMEDLADEKIAFFSCAVNLKNLTLAGLKIGIHHMYDRLLGKGLQNLTQLESLNLGNNNIQFLTVEMFQNLTKLRTLKLNVNFIQSWLPEVFVNFPRLKVLGMYSNRIQTIDRDSFPVGFLDQLDKFHLQGNPFHCDCYLYWFMQYIRQHLGKTRFWIAKRQTFCSYPPSKAGKPVIEFKPDYNKCVLSPFPVEFYLVIGVSCCILITFMLSAVVLKYRWTLRFWYYQMRSRYENFIQIDNRFEYKYDIFVSYSYIDVGWIKTNLLPKFEEELGFRMCLHDRDWLAGKDIVNNIADSITGSHKVVLIVSNAFAQSQWCQLELTMAQHQIFTEDKNRLILIILEDIDKCNMYPRLAHQMRTQTYIKWSEDKVAQKCFSTQLEMALKRKNLSIHKQPV